MSNDESHLLQTMLANQATIITKLERLEERLESYDDLELDQEFYSVSQLVDLLKDRGHPVTDHTIRARWIKEGRLQAAKDPFTRRLKIPRLEVERVLKSGGNPGPPASP